MIKKNSGLQNMYLVLVMVLMFLPIIIIIIYSFNGGKGNIWAGFRLKIIARYSVIKV